MNNLIRDLIAFMKNGSRHEEVADFINKQLERIPLHSQCRYLEEISKLTKDAEFKRRIDEAIERLKYKERFYKIQTLGGDIDFNSLTNRLSLINEALLKIKSEIHSYNRRPIFASEGDKLRNDRSMYECCLLLSASSSLSADLNDFERIVQNGIEKHVGCVTFDLDRFIKEMGKYVVNYNKNSNKCLLLEKLVYELHTGESIPTYERGRFMGWKLRLPNYCLSLYLVMARLLKVASFHNMVVPIQVSNKKHERSPLDDHFIEKGKTYTSEENNAHSINKDELKKYFTLQFKGGGNSRTRTDYFTDYLLPALNVNWSDKNFARIALLIYNSDCLLRDLKPNTFSGWYKLFCDTVGCRYNKNYKKSNLDITDAFKNRFFYLLGG